MQRYPLVGVVVLLMMVATSCIDSSRGAYVVDIEDALWRDVAIVEVPNEDTTSFRNISIFVRHQPYHSLDSLGVTIYTMTPDEVVYSDQLTLQFGRCRRGDHVTSHLHTIPYRRDIVWQQRGIYRVYIFPQHSTEGVEAVGVVVE